MKKILFFIIPLLILCSCRKKIEISKTELYVKGGINDGLTFWKLEKSDSKSYPYFAKYTDVVQLNIGGQGITKQFGNNGLTFHLEDKELKLPESIFLNTPNDYYYWNTVPLYDTTKYSTLPFELENDNWYMINKINIRGQHYYSQFYINKEGEIEHFKYAPIVLSPI